MDNMVTESNANWHKVKLGDFATLHRGYDLPVEKLKIGKYPVIFSNGKIEFHNEYKKEAPGVVTGRSGTLGNTFYVEDNYWPHNTTLFVSDFHGNDPKFIYYLFKRLDFARLNAGSGVPTLNRNHVHEIWIDVPKDVYDQKRIASILSSFDDKIESNNVIIKLLEKVGVTIFVKSFREQRDSKFLPLLEVAKFVNGGAFGKQLNRAGRGLPLIKIADLNQGIENVSEWVDDQVDPKYLIKDGDLLFSWSGSLGIYIWAEGKALLNQHIFRVEAKQEEMKGYLYFYLLKKLSWFQQIAGSKATSMGHIKKEHLQEQQIFVPRRKIAILLNDIYSKIVLTQIENNKLRNVRDLLLPKLMSGRVRV